MSSQNGVVNLNKVVSEGSAEAVVDLLLTILREPQTVWTDDLSPKWILVPSPKHLIMPTRLLLIATLALLATSCAKDPNVIADFSPRNSTVAAGESVTFINQSTGEIVSYLWTFEGGNPATSNEPSPTVVWSDAGVFSVNLEANGDGVTSTQSGSVTVVSSVNYEDEVFEGYTKNEGVVYGIDSEEHLLNLYEPEGDERIERPVLLFFGGGGFAGSNLDQLEPFAIELTKYGVVVAVARYRSHTIASAEQAQEAVMSGIQDKKAAVRYLRKEAETYRLNPDKIIGGGYSTGALLALAQAYMSEAELPADQLDLANSLGGYEGEQGNAGYDSDVSGVVTMAGSMPENMDHLVSGDVPAFLIHGDNDDITSHLAVTNSGGVIIYGSQPISERADDQGVYNDLYLIPGGDHDAPKTAYPDYIDELMLFFKTVIEG